MSKILYSLVFQFLYISLVVATPARGGTYYVSTLGNNSWPGSEASPWRTVKHAANLLQAGDEVLIRGGVGYDVTYIEDSVLPLNSGAPGALIRYRAYPGEQVVIMRSSSADYLDTIRLLEARNLSYLSFEDLKVTTTTIPDSWNCPFGLRGNCHHIYITNCEIYDSRSSGRLGAGIFGAPVQDQNNIFITGCYLHDFSNGGIDFGSSGGQVHDLLIKDCLIENFGEMDGIGVEWNGGASNVTVENCVVRHGTPGTTPDCIDIHADNTRIINSIAEDGKMGVKLTNSSEVTGLITFNNWENGLILQPQDGAVFKITNSVAAHNDSMGNCGFNLGYGHTNPFTVIFKNNIIYSNNKGVFFCNNTGLEADHNLYWSDRPDKEITWDILPGTQETYHRDQIENKSDPGSWFLDSGEGFHSLSLDPLVTADFHLQSEGSPAWNAGTNFIRWEETVYPSDPDGDYRPDPVFEITDIGAYEYGSWSPTPTPSVTPTVTPTPSPSTTPTVTPTPSPSTTPTITPTPSPTITPTATPITPTPSVTPTPSATPTPTVTPTPSVTPTVTPSTTPTPSSTPIPTATLTPLPTASPSSTPITPTPSPTCSPVIQPAYPVIASGDYNGDGTSEIAIFRRSSGLWAVRGMTRTHFGNAADIPVPGDYDGDGCSDIAIFRNNSGLWAIKGVTRVYYGFLDTPIPGDYYGDGSCNIAIYRPATGLWAVRAVTRAYFGKSGDIAVPGYYDFNTTKDIGIFRGSSGLWAIRGMSRTYLGSAGDNVVPGDYDGNGVWEAGIFRSSSGLWAIRGVTRSYFGNGSDLPVPADYKGDGRDDIGIFRGTSGLWAISGASRVYFGSSGDVPVTR